MLDTGNSQAQTPRMNMNIDEKQFSLNGAASKNKFLSILIVVAIAMATLSPPAIAPASAEVTQDRFTVPFMIPFGVPCADLPPGVTSISGVANFFLRTTTRIDSDGGIHLNINGTAFGTAIDNNGVVYSFNYANHISIDIPPGGGFPQQVRMTDHFNLNGTGKDNHMHVGFVIVGSIDGPGDLHIDTINIRGDAFNCDPI